MTGYFSAMSGLARQRKNVPAGNVARFFCKTNPNLANIQNRTSCFQRLNLFGQRLANGRGRQRFGGQVKTDYFFKLLMDD